MNKVIYIHGKGGSAAEAEHFKPLFPNCDVIGFDFTAQTPWEAKVEFPRLFVPHSNDNVTLVANSIGAYFAMTSLHGENIKEGFFISPVVDMEKLICNMMKWAGVSEDELQSKKEIQTQFGEVLSWDYLCYVRENPVKWHIPTHILYGENDELTSFETVSVFAEKEGADLTVMPNGEHWFYTDEQMRFLDEWIRRKQRNTVK